MLQSLEMCPDHCAMIMGAILRASCQNLVSHLLQVLSNPDQDDVPVCDMLAPYKRLEHGGGYTFLAR